MIGSKTFSIEQIEEAMEDCIGFCTSCGAERETCEPDACDVECGECGKHAVFGAEELVVMGRVY